MEFRLYAIALHYTYSNFCRIHAGLTNNQGKPMTPWTIPDLLNLLHGN